MLQTNNIPYLVDKWRELIKNTGHAGGSITVSSFEAEVFLSSIELLSSIVSLADEYYEECPQPLKTQKMWVNR